MVAIHEKTPKRSFMPRLLIVVVVVETSQKKTILFLTGTHPYLVRRTIDQKILASPILLKTLDQKQIV